ncbi:MAG: alanine--glyoxylate aminotransferase family protein [Candidatus Rokubacteria bacterium]|nr:alanine--glyoxylate aminotransferase family protein [Candidatus Rokubacteria bacterium]MBI3827072.1 alanine--glyoxylate aminotransferase family protein [Candidatus Rokubacteria bacterium]
MTATVNWGQCHTRPILMIPGPTEMAFPVIQALNQPPSVQYDQHFDEQVLEPTTLALRDIFQTRGEVIIMPGSGRTALEAAALSVIEPGDRVLVVGAGVFGALMREIMNRAGAEYTEFPVEWGAQLDLDRLARETARVRPKALTLVHNETSTGTTYPAAAVGKIAREAGALFMLDTVSSLAGLDVRTDEWGVDLNMTGSQKCLASPLGMALVSVSPRAWQVMEQRKRRASSWAYDLLRWKENWIPASRGGGIPDGTPRRQPVSIPTHLTAAMSVAARLILEEGLPNRFRRHAVAGAAIRAGFAAMKLDMFPDATLWSNTVSCVRTPTGVDPAAVVRIMRDRHGILIGTGLDRIRTSTIRIGTMGLTASPLYVLPTLAALEMTLAELGYRAEPGAGVAAAQAVFAES